MVGKDYIDLKSLTMDELAGVVHLYPWFGSARKELCERMSRLGGDAWGEAQYADEALYVADRSRLAELSRAGQSVDCSDRDVDALLKSYIAPVSPTAETPQEEQRPVHVVGGDYFSQAQYDDVRREGDNIFSRFAARPRNEGSREEKDRTDIADRFATETLAAIFAEQGYVDEARRIYSRLILDIPEKSAYFASLIDKLN